MVLRLGWYPYLVPDTWLALFIEACRAQIDFRTAMTFHYLFPAD